MKQKKYIGQLIAIKFTDRKTPVNGVVIDYNEDWTLMRYSPSDFVLDGYVILRHKNIGGFYRGEEERFTEKVIRMKYRQDQSPAVPLTDLQAILSYLMDSYGVFQIETKSESACYIGRLNALDSSQLAIKSLTPRGKWSNIMKFRPNDIRVVIFDTDYINSLKLVAKSAGGN